MKRNQRISFREDEFIFTKLEIKCCFVNVKDQLKQMLEICIYLSSLKHLIKVQWKLKYNAAHCIYELRYSFWTYLKKFQICESSLEYKYHNFRLCFLSSLLNVTKTFPLNKYTNIVCKNHLDDLFIVL